MFKILGTDDAVNTCDCCGKSNLKYTVAVEREDGEILHYGSTCVTRHTGKTGAEIKRDIDEALRARIAAAKQDYDTSPEKVARIIAMNKAHAAKLIGRAFKEACTDAIAADNEARARIAAKHNVKIWDIQ